MANPKIANLAKTGAEPQGEIVVVADSDIRVDPGYLHALAADFATDRIGAVTCLYRGRCSTNIVAQLGAMHVEEEFAPSVLVALALGPLHFCLGATMAVRRSVLDAIGGLAALGPYLADDHALGELVAKHGRDVALSRYVVSTDIPETTLGELWSHELRWGRTKRAQAPAGYFFSFLMYALPFAVCYAAAAQTLASLALLGTVVALRLSVHAAARRALGVTRASDWWLVPLRDALSLAIWVASLFGRSVRWRTLGARVSPTGHLQI